MKKFLLALVCCLSFAVISRSDPPEGYQEEYYYFNVKNWQGQYIAGATAALSDYTWIDWQGTSLTADDEGNIIIHFVYPSDPEVPASVAGIQVTFGATGYQNCVYYLGSHHNISIIMDTSH